MRSQQRLPRREEDSCLPQLVFPPPQDAASLHKIPASTTRIHYISSYTLKRVRSSSSSSSSSLYSSSPSLLAKQVLCLLIFLLLQQLDRSQCTTLNAALSGNDQQPERHLQRFEYHLSHLRPPSLVPITVQAISSPLDDTRRLQQEAEPAAEAEHQLAPATGGQVQHRHQERLLQLQLPLQLHLKLRPLPLPMPPPMLSSASSVGSTSSHDNKYNQSPPVAPEPEPASSGPMSLRVQQTGSSGLAAAWREAKRVLLLSSISAGLASKLQLLERRSAAADSLPKRGLQLSKLDTAGPLGEASEAQLLRAARGPRLQRHSAPTTSLQQQQLQLQQPSADIKLSAWSTQGRTDMEPQPSNRLEEQETGPTQLVVGQKAKPWRPSRWPQDRALAATAGPERRRPSYLLYQDSASRSMASEYLDSTRLASEYHMPRVKFQLSRGPSKLENGNELSTGKLARLIEQLAGSANLAPLHPANYSHHLSPSNSPSILQPHSTTTTTLSVSYNTSRPPQASDSDPAPESTTTTSSQAHQAELGELVQEEEAAAQVNSNKVMPELSSRHELANSSSNGSSSQPTKTSQHLTTSADKHIKLFHFKRKPDMNKLPFYKRPLNYTELGWTQGQIEEHQRSLQRGLGADTTEPPSAVASSVDNESDNSTELRLLKRKRRGKSAGSFDRLMAELQGHQQPHQHRPPFDQQSPVVINKRDEPGLATRLVQVTFNGGPPANGQRRRLLSLLGEPMILRPIGLLDASSVGQAMANLSSTNHLLLGQPENSRQRMRQPELLEADKKPSQGLAPSGEESFLLAPSAQPAQHLAPPPPPEVGRSNNKKSAGAGLRVPKLLMKPMRPAKYSLNGYIPKPTLSAVLVMSSPTAASSALETAQPSTHHQGWPQQVAKVFPNSYRPVMSQANPRDLESSTSNEVFSRRRGLQQQQLQLHQRSLRAQPNYQPASFISSAGGANLASNRRLNESSNTGNNQQQLDRAFTLLQLEENKRKYVSQKLAEVKSPTLSAQKAKLLKAKLGLLVPGNQQPLRQPPAAPNVPQPQQPQKLSAASETSTSAIPTSTRAAAGPATTNTTPTPVVAGLSSIPKTDFECTDSSGRFVAGLFADHKTGCQVWHLCSNNRKYSFLCPIGTAFNAKLRICDWRYNVRCEKSSPSSSSSQAAT